MSGRVARRRSETRQRIFTEAMRLFAERGFDNVTVADITEAADVAKGTFFTHFPTKHDVFGHLGEQITSVMLAADLAAGTTQARLARIFTAAAQHLEADPEPIRQMAASRSIVIGRDLGSANQQRLVKLLASILDDGVASGELRRDLSVADAAELLLAGYLLRCLAWASAADTRPLTQRLLDLIDLVRRGMG